MKTDTPKTAPKTVIVERHHYVLDWYEIEKVELDLEHTIYEFNYRFGGDWYLEARKHDGNDWKAVEWPRGGSFRIQGACHALAALGDNVTKFSAISTQMGFHKALAELLDMAGKIRARQEQKA